jgi:hypothetical protein
MLPSEIKLEKNISEYIIYMYQTEDLIKSFNADLNEINKHVIANIQASTEQKKGILLWYAEVIDQMQNEGLVVNQGHLKNTQKYVTELENIHLELIQKDDLYKEVYSEAEESINKNLALSEHTIDSIIQICLNSVYGMLLLKLNGKQLPDDLQNEVELQADVLSYLSKVYKHRQTT